MIEHFKKFDDGGKSLLPLSFSHLNEFAFYRERWALRRIFGYETINILNDLRVEFVSRIGYMGVNDIDGTMIINAYYLSNGDIRDIYLDLIHELVHVKQFRDGKKLFDRRYKYIERATEIEAYRYAVEEARIIGMTDSEIFKYLKTEWMSNEHHKRLAETLKVKNN